jgi:cation:H+ antiporter
MQEFILLIIGLIGLWISTSLVIKGALNIANYYELSQVFVGLSILAIGTDLPELIISIDASIQSAVFDVDTSGIIIGNAIGSSYSQISLVIGSIGLFSYLTLRKKHLYDDGLMLLGSILLLFLFGIDGSISLIEGLVLVIVYGIYYFRLFYNERVGSKIKSKKTNIGLRKDVILLVIGFIFVFFTSNLVVDNAIKFTDNHGLNQSFVGIIIIGLGTSLPELVVSLNAARKKAGGLSVGNLIGSNIFDLLIPVGVGASISEIKVDKMLIYFDLPLLFLLSLLVLFFFYKKRGIQRTEAIILIVFYGVYAFLKILGI